jgi:hypothetical protein
MPPHRSYNRRRIATTRWLNLVAALLTAAITAMGILLILVLAGGAVIDREKQIPERIAEVGKIFGFFGAGLAWPLFALVAAAMLGLLALGAVRGELQSPRRGAALMLGAVALHAAWLLGLRPPAARTGEFLGTYVHGSLSLKPDLLIPCQDPAHPLPRGMELPLGPRDPEIPVMAAIRLPDEGWHGSHPRNWPDSWSDVHGTQYWLVRVRGTLIGPGQYGWPPAMHYRLRVDSVLSVRPDRMFQDECGVYDPPPDWPSLE